MQKKKAFLHNWNSLVYIKKNGKDKTLVIFVTVIGIMTVLFTFYLLFLHFQAFLKKHQTYIPKIV